jgi:hypothetical protein
MTWHMYMFVENKCGGEGEWGDAKEGEEERIYSKGREERIGKLIEWVNMWIFMLHD